MYPLCVCVRVCHKTHITRPFESNMCGVSSSFFELPEPNYHERCVLFFLQPFVRDFMSETLGCRLKSGYRSTEWIIKIACVVQGTVKLQCIDYCVLQYIIITYTGKEEYRTVSFDRPR